MQRWKDSADTMIDFDENYFKDPKRRELYVYLSAMVDNIILDFLNHTYDSLDPSGMARIPLTKDVIQSRIDFLKKVKGVRF